MTPFSACELTRNFHHTRPSTSIAVDTKTTRPDDVTIMGAGQGSSQQTQPSPQQTVFDLPELFEMILKNMDPLDLTRATGINRRARDLVKGSFTLRKAMSAGRCPQPDSRLSIPLIGCPVEEDNCTPGHHSSVRTFFSPRLITTTNRTLYMKLNLGRRGDRASYVPIDILKVQGPGRDILLYQPPVKHASLRPDYFQLYEESGFGPGNGLSREDSSSIDRDTGVTLGDVSDAAHAMRQSYARLAERTSVCCPGFVVEFNAGLEEDEHR